MPSGRSSAEELVILREVKEAALAANAVKSRLKEIESRVRELLSTSAVERVIHVGCGSSYYAALFSTYPLYLHRVGGLALPASELLFLLEQRSDPRSSLVVFYSRSGETREVILALERAKSRGVRTLGLTCTEGSALHLGADRAVVVPECVERSYYMTKSFTTLSILGVAASHALLENGGREGLQKLEAELQAFIEGSEKISQRLDDISELAERTLKKRAFVVLGPGSIYAIALEASLKLNEVAYTFSTAMHALEFRHGPIALREKAEDLQLILLSASSTPANAYVEKLADELRSKGMDVLLVSDRDTADLSIPVKMHSQITYLLLVLPMYYFAIERARRLGYNPDAPLHIERVVKNI